MVGDNRHKRRERRFGSPRNASHGIRETTTERKGVRANYIRDIAASFFPESIPQFNVRRDILTSEEVYRGNLVEKLYGPSLGSEFVGLFDNLGEMAEGLRPLPSRISISEMRARLQCAPNEPGLSAAFKLNELAPPSIEALEWICAFAGITLLFCPHSPYAPLTLCSPLAFFSFPSALPSFRRDAM